MSPEISERSLEEAIEVALLRNGPDATAEDPSVLAEREHPFGETTPGGYRKREPEEYDRTLCLLRIGDSSWHSLVLRIRALIVLGLLSTIHLNCTVSEIAEPEIVMTPGMEIFAKTPNGSIRVLAHDGYKRTYEWNGCKKEVGLRPREERWLGQKGIFYPAPGLTWLRGCGGIHRASLEESQLNFPTEDEFQEWINRYKGVPYVFRNDGLMVGFQTTQERGGLLIVEVHQVLIEREKPSTLKGADDSSISVSESSPLR